MPGALHLLDLLDLTADALSAGTLERDLICPMAAWQPTHLDQSRQVIPFADPE